jgi:hypothetical protein
MSATRMASTASEVGVVTARGRVASLPDDRTRPFSAVRRRRFDVCLGGVISHSLFTLTGLGCRHCTGGCARNNA